MENFERSIDEGLLVKLENLDNLPEGALLHINGYIDTGNSEQFELFIKHIIDSGYKHLIFDCDHLSYVSSTGIGNFTSIIKKLMEHGGNSVFLDVRPKFYELLQLLGFLSSFKIKKNLEEAIDYISKNNRENKEIHNIVFACPVCLIKLMVSKPGRFICWKCKSKLKVESADKITRILKI